MAYTEESFNESMEKLAEECYEYKGSMLKTGAELTTAKRESLKPKQFALPGKEKYPIPDKIHGKNALTRVSQFGTPAERSTVRQKVYAKFPDLKKKFEQKAGVSPTSKEVVKKPRLGQVTGQPSEAQSPRYMKAHEKAVKTAALDKVVKTAALNPVMKAMLIGGGIGTGVGTGIAGYMGHRKGKEIKGVLGKNQEKAKSWAVRHPMATYMLGGVPLGSYLAEKGLREELQEKKAPKKDKVASILGKNAALKKLGQEYEMPEDMPQPGALVKHPVAATLGGGAAGAVGGGGLGYLAGKAIPSMGPQIGAGVGATLGALLGAALGAREAEQSEESYSQQLADYLSKASSLAKTAKKEKKVGPGERWGRRIGAVAAPMAVGATFPPLALPMAALAAPAALSALAGGAAAYPAAAPATVGYSAYKGPAMAGRGIDALIAKIRKRSKEKKLPAGK